MTALLSHSAAGLPTPGAGPGHASPACCGIMDSNPAARYSMGPALPPVGCGVGVVESCFDWMKSWNVGLRLPPFHVLTVHLSCPGRLAGLDPRVDRAASVIMLNSPAEPRPSSQRVWDWGAFSPSHPLARPRPLAPFCSVHLFLPLSVPPFRLALPPSLPPLFIPPSQSHHPSESDTLSPSLTPTHPSSLSLFPGDPPQNPLLPLLSSLAPFVSLCPSLHRSFWALRLLWEVGSH